MSNEDEANESQANTFRLTCNLFSIVQTTEFVHFRLITQSLINLRSVLNNLLQMFSQSQIICIIYLSFHYTFSGTLLSGFHLQAWVEIWCGKGLKKISKKFNLQVSHTSLTVYAFWWETS